MGMHKCMPIPPMCASEHVLISDVITPCNSIILQYVEYISMHPPLFLPSPAALRILCFIYLGKWEQRTTLGMAPWVPPIIFFWRGKSFLLSLDLPISLNWVEEMSQGPIHLSPPPHYAQILCVCFLQRLSRLDSPWARKPLCPPDLPGLTLDNPHHSGRLEDPREPLSSEVTSPYIWQPSLEVSFSGGSQSSIKNT